MEEYEIQRKAALLVVDAFDKLDNVRQKYNNKEYAGGAKAYRSVIGRIRQKLARDIMHIWYEKNKSKKNKCRCNDCTGSTAYDAGGIY